MDHTSESEKKMMNFCTNRPPPLFVIVNKELINDKTLSPTSRWILIYIDSEIQRGLFDDEEFERQIKNHITKKNVERIIKELKNAFQHNSDFVNVVINILKSVSSNDR